MRHQVKNQAPVGYPYELPKRVGNVLLGKNSTDTFLHAHGSYPCVIEETTDQDHIGASFDGSVVIVKRFVPASPDPVEMFRATAAIGPLQMRRALRELGLKDAVDAFVAAQSADVREEWVVSTSFKRLDPMVMAAASHIGLTDDDIDDLFKLGMTLA
jgi:hypothetical protein